MVSIRYANAMKEVLSYLEGIRQEDRDKISKKFMSFLEENASKEYNCEIDYTKSLKDIDLTDEAKGIIVLICYKYWCNTKELKQELLEKLNENEKKFQAKKKEKYNVDKVFKEKEETKPISNTSNNLPAIKENIIQKIYRKTISIIKRIIRY